MIWRVALSWLQSRTRKNNAKRSPGQHSEPTKKAARRMVCANLGFLLQRFASGGGAA
jgi:hypothetical protein